MNYSVEILDPSGLRVAAYDHVPLMEAVAATPDQRHVIRGMLPSAPGALGHGFRVRFLVEGRLFCEGVVDRLAPYWGDQRKLVLDRYVNFREVIAFRAQSPLHDGNTSVVRAYTHREIGDLVKDALNTANGRVHYTVAHEAYPDGAVREFQKFAQRMTPDNALGLGGIASGQWVGADRIDASGAYAKDGDTIAGLVVDGEAWPDLRMMMIDTEELARNSHAIKRHPEVAHWSAARYAKSGYRLQAEAARAALQELIDVHGIGFVELNPHRDATGAYDDRVDAYGRYIGLVYGGGQCFNAAMVELGRSEVYLYADGAYHVPDMALKEYFSYLGPNRDSVAPAGVSLASFASDGGVFETLTAAAYAAGGGVWCADPDLRVAFGRTGAPDHVVAFDPLTNAVAVGSNSEGVANLVFFNGNPLAGALKKTYARSASISAFGQRGRRLNHFGISLEEDADKLCQGLLDDLAYPEPEIELTFFRGRPDLRVGDLIEVRGAPLRRLDLPAGGEWGERLDGRIAGRAHAISHYIYGRRTVTTVRLGSPLRSVRDPVAYMMRSQPTAATIYQFRLDDAVVGADMGYHLD